MCVVWCGVVWCGVVQDIDVNTLLTKYMLLHFTVPYIMFQKHQQQTDGVFLRLLQREFVCQYGSSTNQSQGKGSCGK